jgi:hypothetical protein
MAYLDLSLYHAGGRDFDHGELLVRFPESVQERRSNLEDVGGSFASDDEMSLVC